MRARARARAASAASNLASLGAKAIQAKQTLDALSAASKFLNANAGVIRFSVVGAGGILAAVEALRIMIDAAGDAQDRLDDLVKIGASASAAGVGTSFFQAWRLQAKGLNAETADLVAMLDKARAAATQTIGDAGGTSSSPGADRIKQNVRAGNLPGSALASYSGAGDQEARIRVVLGLIDQLRQKGEQLAAFDLGKTFFGEGFETRLRNGVDIVGDMRKALDGLQVAGGERIVSQLEIANTQHLRNELDAINDRLAKASEPFAHDLVMWQNEMLETTIKLKTLWVDIVEAIAKAAQWLETVDNKINAIPGLTDFRLHVQQLAQRGGLANITGGATLLNSMLTTVLPAMPKYGPDMPPEAQQLPAITIRGDRSHALPSLTPAKAASSEKTDQVETYINSLKKQTAAEEAEAATLGLGNKARQEAIDLARAQEAASERRTPLTQAEADQVRKLADGYVDAKPGSRPMPRRRKMRAIRRCSSARRSRAPLKS